MCMRGLAEYLADADHRTGQESRSTTTPYGNNVIDMTTAKKTTATTTIEALTLEVEDPAAARRFYREAFDLGDEIGLRASDAPTSGFRGFTLSLLVAQPADVRSLVDTAVAAGATTLVPAEKSFWGFGGVVQAPDGTIWKVTTSNKKDKGPVSREVESIVLLLGAGDVAASKRFYVEHGLTVAKSFGKKYVEFESGSGRFQLGLYGRKALAKTSGVAPDGTGSHRLIMGGGTTPFTDPDGFEWQPATAGGEARSA